MIKLTKTMQFLAVVATLAGGYAQAASNYPAPVPATQSSFAPVIEQTTLYVPPMSDTLAVENLKAQFLQTDPDVLNAHAVIFYEKKQRKNAQAMQAFLKQQGMPARYIQLKMQKMPLYPLYVEVRKTGKALADCQYNRLDKNFFQETYKLQDMRPCYLDNNARLQYTE